MENPDFLKQKYDLHNAPEVEQAAGRTEMRTGERVPQNPQDRIQNYLDRFKQIVEREDLAEREQGIEAFKRVLHNKFVIQPDDIPESTFLLEQRIAREQGYGDVEITEEFKEQKTAQIIRNQTQSLDKWVNYLSSPDASVYPDWAKYWAFRSMLEMGKLQKQEDEHGKEAARFQKRTTDTIASFPPLNPRALALAIGVLRSRLAEKVKSKQERQPVENKSVKLTDPEFQNLLSTENFSKIYTQFLIELPEYSTEGLQEIRGQWVKYPQGSEAALLVKSLEGYPLEWCTASDIDTAQTQLKGGDFYVYYSINESGEAKIPRLAIRMQGEQIAEDPRGIAPDQNLDPYIVPVLEEKLKDFGPESDAYKKKSADMKQLTAIERKMHNAQPLTKTELVFLYEMERPIEGFGYPQDGKCSDPRIKELRDQRNPREDAPIILEVKPDQIAWSQEAISEATQAYIGPLFPGIFELSFEHLYTSFPESRIVQRSIKLGTGLKTAADFQQALAAVGDHINSWGNDIMGKPEFQAAVQKTEVDLVTLSVKGLGFPQGATREEIYIRAKELGLKLVPAEVGPQLRLEYQKQTNSEWPMDGKKHIDSNGYPFVWIVKRVDGGQRWLYGIYGRADDRWGADYCWVFGR